MTPNQKPPKAGPFYKAAFLFGRSPTMDTWNFLLGFCILSYISGCWLYAFPEKDDFIVLVPFFVSIAVSLIPLYIYGAKSALDEEKTQNYFAYFVQKKFWYVGSAQALLMLAFGLLASCLEMVVGFFTHADIFKVVENPLQLFVGAFSTFIITHFASGRSLPVSKVLSASALAFAPSLGLYALFFILPMFMVMLVEVFFYCAWKYEHDSIRILPCRAYGGFGLYCSVWKCWLWKTIHRDNKSKIALY